MNINGISNEKCMTTNPDYGQTATGIFPRQFIVKNITDEKLYKSEVYYSLHTQLYCCRETEVRFFF